MKKLVLLVIFCLLMLSVECYAYWVWSPETNKWINPQYRVFDTPQEQFEWAKGYFDQGDYRKALSEFRKLVRKFKKDRLAPEAMFYIGQCYEEIGKIYKAYEEYQNIIKTYPLTERLEQIVERQYVIAEKYYSKRHYDRAREIMEQALMNAPYSKVSDVLQYTIALCYLRINDFHNARIEFEKLVDAYGFSPYVDDATFQIGFCAFKVSSGAKDYDEELVDNAIEDLEYYLRRFPTSSHVAQTEKLLAKLKDKKAQKLFNAAYFYEKQRKTFAAIKYYENLIYDYPNTAWGQKGRQRLERIRDKQPNPF